GWVRDPAEPERVLHVSAWLDGEKLLEVPANERRFRPETADGHGFSLTLPLKLADGLSRHIQLLDEEKCLLPGSPVLVCALPQGVAGWFAAQKKLDAPQRELVSRTLAHYEEWLPKGVRLDQFAVWRECFPLPGADKLKEAVLMVDSRQTTPQALLQTLSEQGYVLLHQGENLHPQAVAHLVAALKSTAADLVYADGSARQDDGTLLPLCRSAWDIYRFLCIDDIGPFLVRASLLHEVASQNDTASTLHTRLVLTAHERQGIRHFPQFLSETETSFHQPDEGHIATVRTWLRDKTAGLADVEPMTDAPSRLRCTPSRTPLVSLLIPTRDKATMLRSCLESLNTSTYKNIEILILDNASQEEETFKLFQSAEQGEVCRFPVRVLRWAGAFNYAS
ncbi:MAG: glycosyltransferase family A protein, partial [Bilophila sp.]